MSTHDTTQASRYHRSILRALRIGALISIVLAAPLVTACTDTVTGLDQASDNGGTTEASGHLVTDSLPVAQ